MQGNEITPVPERPEYDVWVQAAYGRISELNAKFDNIHFTESGMTRMAQIAGWITGLVFAGREDMAEQAATAINQSLSYLNGYGGMVQGETFSDGSPIEKVPRYKIELSDDGTFGGFRVTWHKAEMEGNNAKNLLRNRWDDTVKVYRYRRNETSIAEEVRYVYPAVMFGGLIYHGPKAGETFSVYLGSDWWGIHT